MNQEKTNKRKIERIEKRRDQIAKEAMTLFRKNGYHATTMRQICKIAHVNQGSFYNYFKGKKDVLVYIYRKMMLEGREINRAFQVEGVPSLNKVEQFLKSLLSNAWNRDKQVIQLLYRETISLDKRMRKEVLQIESDFINWVAEHLQKGLRVSSINRKLEMIANLSVFMSSFIPLRGWNLHHVEQTEILDFVVGVLMKELRDLQIPNGSMRKKK